MRIGRILALGCALGTLAITLSACDTSPPAAAVNGRVISVAYLNNQLKDWSSNRAWVKTFDSANSTANGGTGTTVTGSGGPGTFSSSFVADILDTIVQYRIINDYLSSRRTSPSQDYLVASRAVNEFLRTDYWNQFSVSLRQFLVDQLAEEAVLTPLSADQSTIQSAFSQIEPYLFSQICFVQASEFSRSAAQTMSGTGTVSGTQVCLDQADFEGEPADFQRAVIALKPGEVSKPLAVSYGYAVVQLLSKKSPGLSKGVQQVLSAATATNIPPTVSALISRARVKVNPAFGTWSNGQINPPKSLTSS